MSGTIPSALHAFLVSHTHWDREWYRTFQEFRARLVDAVDRLLALLAADSEYRFVLDGQAIIVEDYLAIRPERRIDLRRFCREGRLALGPWYVQPDSFLPAGETHVRNLLFGMRLAEQFGASSRVAYTPDSFGHPAQFPQLFAGFGLKLFVYWRGNGDELDSLPPTFLWVAPDGSALPAHHLRKGYFNAAGLPRDPHAAARFLQSVVKDLCESSRDPVVLLMHGIDHAFPQPHTGEVARVLSILSGVRVTRATLDEFADALPTPTTAYSGELRGARIANLLPGVWSSRMHAKAENRRCESLLLHWLEPWAALTLAITGHDERAALNQAWSALLQNQAHDSIGGCSQDRVHDQMAARFDVARELAEETTRRILDRLAGLDERRETPPREPWSVYVFNPSPYPRTEIVRLPIDPHPWFGFGEDAERNFSLHPLLMATGVGRGFVIDNTPARVVEDHEAPRMRLDLSRPPQAIEFVARNVPPFGCLKLPLHTEDQPATESCDEGTEIRNEFLRVQATTTGTFDLEFVASGSRYVGLANWEDLGDRGDTYDFDPVPGMAQLDGVAFRRTHHPSGIQTLRIERKLRVPSGLKASREERCDETVTLPLVLELCVAPGIPRLDIEVTVFNTAKDHRLRLLFPTGQPASAFAAATTFDIATRSTKVKEKPDWVHPPPRTFPHHGFVSVNGLTVTAPELPEAEVTPDGTIAITLLRSVGWLALPGLKTRAELAGPIIATPQAQCSGRFQTRIALSEGVDAHTVRDLSAGLWAVIGGESPILHGGESLLSIEPRDVVLSALLPALRGRALWLRLLNPWDRELTASVRFGFRIKKVHSIRLDGRRTREPFAFQDGRLQCQLKPHQLRSFALLPDQPQG
ncbi:MAG: hypothetical protein N3C12_03470 [Candidatus Binatia bacterium]|nr:hypothetical protein [Candidatus Binatia bacterium]